jgi:hypothetical protein
MHCNDAKGRPANLPLNQNKYGLLGKSILKSSPLAQGSRKIIKLSYLPRLPLARK